MWRAVARDHLGVRRLWLRGRCGRAASAISWSAGVAGGRLGGGRGGARVALHDPIVLTLVDDG
eukprot:scaffold183238_cov31-Tisochrysis_lutea.AAC.3